MSEIQAPESPHERRVTWGLMAAVVIFVLLMSCIVVWVMSSLIRQERSGASPAIRTSVPSAVATVLPVLEPTALPTSTPTIDEILIFIGPTIEAATWTPPPGPKRYVRFVYWKVKPNRITLGECIQITWKTEFAASLRLYRNGELFVDRAPAATTLQDCPKKLGYVTYRLVGWNHVGESNWVQLQVKVLEAP